MTDKEIIQKYKSMDKRQAVSVIADLCGVERLEIIKVLESHGITPPGRRPVDLYRRLEELDRKIKYHDKWKKVWEERYKKVAERKSSGERWNDTEYGLGRPEMRKDEFDIVEKYAQKKTTKALGEAYEEVCATRNGITGDTEYILGVRVGLSMARDIIAYHARKEEDEQVQSAN